jgi:hypothetical protein
MVKFRSGKGVNKMFALRVTLWEPTDDRTEKLTEIFGTPVCSEYRTYWFRYTWVFDSMEEALRAEKIAQSIIGGSEHGYTKILGPDDVEEEENEDENED